MRLLVLLILAVIAYLLYKKFTSNKQPEHPALDDPSSSAKPDNQNTLANSGDSRNAESGAEQSSPSAGSTSGNAAAGVTAAAGATAAAATAGAAASAPHTAGTPIPDSGNQIADIQEMLKILNLRPSDAPRLSISAEQYASLKDGQAADLSGEVLDTIIGKLKAML